MSATEEPVASPAERLLYALGQLYRLHHVGELGIAPADFDVLDLARIIGVAREIELVTEGLLGRSFHFASEVLVLDPRAPFPWRLLSDEEWAHQVEIAELEAMG